MRIAYVSADQGVPVFGCKGCSIHVQEVLRALVNRGAEIDLFTPRIGGETPSCLESVRLHRLPTISDGDTATREKRALEANDELAKALMKSGPFDWIYERYSLWSHAGMDFAAKVGIPG
ncbi:MAG TPA: hypothetical protein VGZ25_07015, partial [Gemmataceae bacterium]|nr:hypothetical protein [Gemmataceae bacterium]